MHMADALLSPAVGSLMWAATASAVAYSAKKVRHGMDDSSVPLMGVLGAFIFAAQMINFTIPGTGSSGHLCGGMILAILLGPYAALLVMASVLTVQAFFFADGGLLALGSNIFNMGVVTCFIAYPFVFKPIFGKVPRISRIMAASVAASIVGLQLGSLGVVMETVLSGISDVPFRSFLYLMQPIHLAIGIVEGIVTAAVVTFLFRVHPEILILAPSTRERDGISKNGVLVGIFIAALLMGGVLSWFASGRPDGLEWSLRGMTAKVEGGHTGEKIHDTMDRLQRKTSILPNYDFKSRSHKRSSKGGTGDWPLVGPGKSVSGIVGGGMTLVVVIGIGWIFRRRAR